MVISSAGVFRMVIVTDAVVTGSVMLQRSGCSVSQELLKEAGLLSRI